MKKRSLLITGIISALLLAGCASGQTEVNYVGTDNAKAAALEAAGFAKEEVAFEAAELNERNGQKYYGVDFTFKGEKYSCDIDALTGKVINYRGPEAKEAVAGEAAEKTTNAPAESTEKKEGKQPQAADDAQKDLIGEEKAKEIAMKHAGVNASQVSFVKSGLDRDDGRRVYDVEFYTNDNVEYDYDIDAYNGEILSFDHDAEYYAPKSDKKNDSANVNKAENAITEEKAKEIALAQVPGATLDDLWEFETDYDDGRLEYEGKIFYDHKEYEFEIDGYSGAIRNWEVESIYD